jgi:transposase InsO family protein
VAHPRARLNVFGRSLLVHRVTVEGWPAALAAEAMGISRATGYKWVRRYRAEGVAGLADRRSRPHRSPRLTPAADVERILTARAELRWGPDRLGPVLGLPPSTVAAVLRRAGVPRLADLDRPSGLPVRRYEVCHPGQLLHQDHKKLGRIPDGGGWRGLGHRGAPHHGHSHAGYEHLEVLIDDASRYTVVVPVADETAASAVLGLETAAAEFARLGIRIERVLTDNGAGYKSHAYRDTVAGLGARHKRTRPWRPQTNGKAERVIQTLLREWAYGRLYRSNAERELALPAFVDFYNRRRPHTALGGRSPLDDVNNVLGDHS